MVVVVLLFLPVTDEQFQKGIATLPPHIDESKSQQTKQSTEKSQHMTPPQAQTVSAVPDVNTSSTKYDLMRTAGIPESDWASADYIIERESSWRHDAWNKEGSGAYGLCQSLPANKMASAGVDYMTNPITQLRWCHQYAISRYGSWQAAVTFWKRTDPRPYSGHWW